MKFTPSFDVSGNPVVQKESFKPFSLRSGRTCPEVRVGFCVFAEKPDLPVIVLHPALTGSPKAWINGKGSQGEGWFSEHIGPGKFLDTDKYCIVCVDPIGGNGDSSAAKELRLYLADLSFADGIEATAMLLKRKGVHQVHAVIGGSIGGGQAFEWLFQNHVQVKKIFDISGSACRTKTASEFFLLQSELLDFEKLGNTDLLERLEANTEDLLGSSEAYDLIYQKVKSNLQELIADFNMNMALKVARQIGFLRFVTPQFYQGRFETYIDDLEGRSAAEDRLISWIEYQGESFLNRFCPEALKQLCYMDSLAVRRAPEVVAEALSNRNAELIGFSVKGDVLFPHSVQADYYRLVQACLPSREQSLVNLVSVEDPLNGHDHFLTEHFSGSAKLLKEFL